MNTTDIATHISKDEKDLIIHQVPVVFVAVKRGDIYVTLIMIKC